MRRVIQILIYFSFIFYAIIGNGCNSVPEQVIKNNEFDPNLMNNALINDTFYIFNPLEGFQQNFSGTRTKTTITADSDTMTETEQIYCSFTTLEMSVQTVNDTIYGSAGFKKADICDWYELLRRMQFEYHPLGRIVNYNLTEEDLDQILSCASPQYFSSSDSNAIVEAFTAVIKDVTFYQHYRDTIHDWIFDPNTLDTLVNEVEQMVERNIFTDTSGTVASNLTPVQQEELKWFNWWLLTKFIDDQYGRVLTKYPATPRLFSILFQQGTSRNQLHQNEAERYLTISNDMMDLVLADYNGTLITFDDYPYTKVSKYKISTCSPWIVGPLFNPSDIPFISTSDLLEVCLPGNAIIYLVRYSTGGDTMFYNFKCYYSLSGIVQQNKQPLDIAGTITISADLFKLPLEELIRDQGYFLSWDTEINIRKKDESGEITLYRETRILKADNG